jgi:hypothetical protein
MSWLHGAGGLFGYHALFFAAVEYAPAAEANLLNYAWPFLIVVLSAPILGLHLTRHHLLGVTIGLGGSLLLLARGTNFGVDAIFGYACAIGAAFTWAIYSVLAGRFRAVPTQAVIGFCAGGAVLAAIAHTLFEVCYAHRAGNGMRPVAWRRASLGCVPVVGYRHEAGRSALARCLGLWRTRCLHCNIGARWLCAPVTCYRYRGNLGHARRLDRRSNGRSPSCGELTADDLSSTISKEERLLLYRHSSSSISLASFQSLFSTLGVSRSGDELLVLKP